MQDFNICLIGDVKTGKTTFLNYLIYNVFKSEYEATIGVDFTSKDIIVNNKKIKWKIWDTTGNKNMISIFNGYFSKIDAFLLFFDNSKIYNLESLEFWVTYIKKKCENNHRIFLISNNSTSFNNIPVTDIDKFCKNNNLIYIKAFLKTRISVEKIITEINNCLIPKTPKASNKKKSNNEYYFELESSKSFKNKCCIIM